MHFGTKSYLKNNRNHTAKQTLNVATITGIINQLVINLEEVYGRLYTICQMLTISPIY